MNKLKTIVIVIIVLYLAALISSSLLTSTPLASEFSSNGIALIKIDGTIVSNGGSGLFSSGNVDSDTVIAQINQAEKASGVKAIIFEINSGGGAVVASKEIADKIKTVEKPTIALIREVGASGAYWAASSTDYVIADELSITGSIGVIASYLEFSGLMEKYGVEYEGLTTGKYKDTGTPYRDLTPEERALLIKKLEIIEERFIQDIAKNRNLEAEKVRSLATGMFFLGIEAKELGLVDELGGRDLAIQKAKEMANLKDEKVVEYVKKPSLLNIFDDLTTQSFYSIGRGIGDSIKKEEDIRILAK